MSKEERSNVISLPSRYYIRNFQGQLKFNHHLVKEEILEEQPIYRSDIGIVRYENGVYKRSTNADILHIIQNKIGEEATKERKREILDLILHEYKIKPLSSFNRGVRQLNLKNGLYNLTTKSFTKHNPYILWTIQQPIEYDPEATCPAILEFLHDIVDDDAVQFVIDWLAFMCLPYVDNDKILFLLGKGGNGKSALLNIFQYFLGEDNITNMSLQDLTEDKFSRAQLYGKTGNICGDIDSKIINNASVMKTLTGIEPVFAQFKGVDGFTFKSFAKIVFSANEMPMTSDKTNGFFRRKVILPVDKTVPEEKKVPRSELDKRLTNPRELSGLLNLVIEAIHKLEKNHYKMVLPESVKRASKEYEYIHDKVEQFIDEHCIVDKKDKSKKVPLDHFYSGLKDWVAQSGMKYTEQIRKVGEQLREKGYEVRKSTGNRAYIFGLSISKNSYYYKNY